VRRVPHPPPKAPRAAVAGALATVLGSWRLWMPPLLAVSAAVAAAQFIQHRFFMQVPMFQYHFISGVLQAALIAVPLVLYLLWRAAAHRERAALDSLRASEALREDMTHMLVHDLKNPLAAAIMALEMVIRHQKSGRASLEAGELEMLSIAFESQKRLLRMVGDLLDVARAEAGELPLALAPASLHDIVQAAVHEASAVAQEKGLHLSLDSSPYPPLAADAEKVRRVVDNLLGNAVKFTPPDGQISVRLEQTSEEARVTVRDTGPGIPQHLHQRIFDKFGQAQAAREGHRMSVGLGLAFCRLVVEAHGGRIWVESAPGAGSAFTFSLPVGAGTQAPAH